MNDFTSSAPSPEVLRGIHRLARAHSHAWAWECEEDHLASDQAAAFAKAAAALDESPNRPVGLYPALSHVTGSGRLAWGPGWDGLGVDLRVSRPAGGVLGYAGGYHVVEGTIRFLDDGSISLSFQIDARPGVGVHLRHLAAAERAAGDAMGAGSSEAESEGSALERVRMHAEGDWGCDQYYGGSAAELVARLDVEAAALDAERALALASPARYLNPLSYGEPVAVGVAGWEPDASTVP